MQGAVRILEGQAPYSDFFVLTGPGCFWLLAVLFFLFGVTLEVGRLLPIIDLACLTGCVFWLTAKLTNRGFGLLVAFAFLAVQAANPDPVVINHRLDSSALALLAVALSIGNRPVLAGLAAAGAAWITPPMLTIVAAILFWRWREGGMRQFVAGVSAGSAFAAGWLVWKGALIPMVEHLLWSGANYAGANRDFYGSIVGGWANLFEDASGAELIVRAIVIGFCFGLPVVLPVATLAAWPLKAWRTREEVFLALAGAAILISSLPRPNVTNLRYLCGVFFVLGAVLLLRFRYWRAAAATAAILSLLFLSVTAFPPDRQSIETPRGVVRADEDGAALLEPLLGSVRPGDTLFVYPYEPVVYFVTAARNVTRYSFLQPGMMTSADEQSALSDLRESPPDWVYYSDVPAKAYLRIWPNSDPSRLRFENIERWIREEYETAHTIKLSNADYQLMRLKAAR